MAKSPWYFLLLSAVSCHNWDSWHITYFLVLCFSSEPKIVVSNSAGVLTLVDVTNTGLVPANQWKAHDFEAWITAFNYHDTNIVYSGNWFMETNFEAASYWTLFMDMNGCS